MDQNNYNTSTKTIEDVNRYVESIVCEENQVNLEELCKELKKRGIYKLKAKGGGTRVICLFQADDDLCTYIENMIIEGADAPRRVNRNGCVLADEFTDFSLSRMENGMLLSWHVNG